jgi:hypothetical protein
VLLLLLHPLVVLQLQGQMLLLKAQLEAWLLLLLLPQAGLCLHPS